MKQEITIESIAKWVENYLTDDQSVFYQDNDYQPFACDAEEREHFWDGQEYTTMAKYIRDNFTACEIIDAPSWDDLNDGDKWDEIDHAMVQWTGCITKDEYEGQECFVRMYGHGGEFGTIALWDFLY